MERKMLEGILEFYKTSIDIKYEIQEKELESETLRGDAIFFEDKDGMVGAVASIKAARKFRKKKTPIFLVYSRNSNITVSRVPDSLTVK